jgi:outer membrane receptor protein involved in Fe transport
LGGEYSWRRLDVPYRFVCAEPDGCPSATKTQRWADWDERFGRAYLYWAPRPWLAATLEYQYEWVDRADASRPQSGDELVGEERLHFLKTHRVPLGLRVFLPSGLFAGVRGTYLRQKGAFQDPSIITGEPARGEDQFWVFDAAVGYRLPKRYGVVQVGVRNLFDQRFQHQDTDPANPRIYPERFLFAGFTLAF